MRIAKTTAVALLVASPLALSAGLLAGCKGETGGPVEIFDMQPRSVPSSGEQPVRVTGKNFRPGIGYSVYFGATRSGTVTMLDNATLLVSAPQHEPGTVDVTITADDGPAFLIKGGFSYTGGAAAPAGGTPGANPSQDRY